MNKKLLVAAMLLTIGSQNVVNAKITKASVTHLDGTTTLIEAVKSGKKSNFKTALKVADVNFVDKSGKTAMDYAAENNNKKFIFELAKQHARVTTEKNRGIILTTLQHKITAYKGGGIAWLLAGPAWLVGGTGFLARRGTWKAIATFYNDPRLALV